MAHAEQRRGLLRGVVEAGSRRAFARRKRGDGRRFGGFCLVRRPGTRLAMGRITYGECWGRCTTHFSTYFSGDWDVHQGCGILTHSHLAPRITRPPIQTTNSREADVMLTSEKKDPGDAHAHFLNKHYLAIMGSHPELFDPPESSKVNMIPLG